MKPSLPRFIYFTTEHGQYILCTEYPFVVGQVWKFTSEKDMQDHYFSNVRTPSRIVDGYNVMIVYVGELDSDESHSKNKGSAIKEMSSFFLSRINERPMGWRRYKIEKL